MSKEKKEKVFVIGIDGATFKIIDRLINADQLPNLKKLIDRGCRAKFISVHPILSPVNWTSIITGVNPGKHGIFDFIHSPAKDYRIAPLNGSARKAPSIFSYLSDQDFKVGAVNVPYTYPPEKVNGIIVSGMDTPPKAADFVYPPELKAKMDKYVGNYFINIPLWRNGDQLNIKSNLAAIKNAVKSRTRAATFVMERLDWDFLMMVYIVTDRVQHEFWDQMEKKDSDRTIIIDETYRLIDESIGKLLDKLDDLTNVIVVSDHGFESLQTRLVMRNWLKTNNYLKENDTNSAYKRRFHVAGQKIKYLLKRQLRLSLQFSFMQQVLQRLKFKHPDKMFAESGLIDWTRTKAFCVGAYGNIYINLKGRNPDGQVAGGDEYESLRKKIKAGLLAITDQKTGLKPVKEVFFKEDLFSGSCLDEAPDLVAICESGYSTSGLKAHAITNGRNIQDGYFNYEPVWTGNHEPEGIFIAAGPGIKSGKTVNDLSVLDFVPAVLYLMDAPVPKYLDGHIPTALFRDSLLKARPVKMSGSEAICSKQEPEYAYNESENAAMEKRLKDLGYL